MPDEKEHGKLSWFKWTVEDAKLLSETLTETQVGTIFLAVMKAAETGELDVDSVPPELQIVYRLYCQKAFAAISAYSHKCEVNARNGAKGGRAKADNARKANDASQTVHTFKPPTKTEFKNMAKHIRSEFDVDLDAYEIDRIYDVLAGSEWKYGGAPLTTRSQIEAVIYAEGLHDSDYTLAAQLFLEKGYTDLEAYTIEILFVDYDDDRRAWQLCKRGPWYSTVEEVVDAYLTDDLEDIT